MYRKIVVFLLILFACVSNEQTVHARGGGGHGGRGGHHSGRHGGHNRGHHHTGRGRYGRNGWNRGGYGYGSWGYGGWGWGGYGPGWWGYPYYPYYGGYPYVYPPAQEIVIRREKPAQKHLSKNVKSRMTNTWKKNNIQMTLNKKKARHYTESFFCSM